MATQGLVSVIDPDEVMLLKVVIGQTGYRAKELALELLETGDTDPKSVFERATRIGMTDVVVIGRDEHYHECDDMEGLNERYVATFNLRGFNPRCMSGGGEHKWVVEQAEIVAGSLRESNAGPRVMELCFPLFVDEVDRGIDSLCNIDGNGRSSMFFWVPVPSPEFYKMLGRLYHYRRNLTAGKIPNPGGKTFSELTKGE